MKPLTFKMERKQKKKPSARTKCKKGVRCPTLSKEGREACGKKTNGKKVVNDSRGQKTKSTLIKVLNKVSKLVWGEGGLNKRKTWTFSKEGGVKRYIGERKKKLVSLTRTFKQIHRGGRG